MSDQTKIDAMMRLDNEAGEVSLRSEIIAALQQIERLSREANRNMVDVPALLGDIARAALTKARP